MPMERIEKIEIEKIVFGGKGLGRLKGQIVFVEQALPGEKAIVKLKEKKHYLEGEIIEIENPSRFRVEPDCPYYPQCGGCSFRHCEYPFELELKKDIVVDTLSRIGKIFIEKDFIETLSKDRNFYRIKTGFKARNGKIGFFKRKSHQVVDIEYCFQCPESANNLLKKMRKRRVNRDFFIEAHPFEENAQVYFKGEIGKEIELNFGNHKMLHRAGNFIQANRYTLKDFVNLVVEMAGKGGKVLELYCGSGLFSLPLSLRVDRVTCYEQSKSAIECLKKSIELNGFKNIETHCIPSELFLEENFDTVLVDPPRDGLQGKVLHKIKKLSPAKVVYVSCNVSTLARDIKNLANYTLKKLVLVDNFPATSHIEICALLERLF